MTRKEPPSGGAATMPGSTWAGGHTTPSESDSWRLKLFPEPVVSPFREGASRSSTPGGQASRSFPLEGVAASGVAASGLGAGGDCGFCANAGAARTASVLATIRTGRMRILVVERESPVEKTPVSSALFRGQPKQSVAKPSEAATAETLACSLHGARQVAGLADFWLLALRRTCSCSPYDYRRCADQRPEQRPAVPWPAQTPEPVERPSRPLPRAFWVPLVTTTLTCPPRPTRP